MKGLLVSLVLALSITPALAQQEVPQDVKPYIGNWISEGTRIRVHFTIGWDGTGLAVQKYSYDDDRKVTHDITSAVKIEKESEGVGYVIAGTDINGGPFSIKRLVPDGKFLNGHVYYRGRNNPMRYWRD
jgi:hypothetical protein